MIKVAFCDDETKILEDLSVKIKKEFEKINCEIDLYTTENSIRLLEYLKSCPVDILFWILICLQSAVWILQKLCSTAK